MNYFIHMIKLWGKILTFQQTALMSLPVKGYLFSVKKFCMFNTQTHTNTKNNRPLKNGLSNIKKECFAKNE